VRKRFGQHFLVDGYTIERIIELIAPQACDHILEIGPGGGVLTDDLVASGAHLVAVEIDRDLIKNLNRKFADKPNFTVHNADILKFDLSQLSAIAPRWKIVGNLPYNISTPLIMALLEHAQICSEMTFMLQLEVAQRLYAEVGSSAYGRLSVMAQRRARINHRLTVAADCFKPPPKVESAVVQLQPQALQSTPGIEAALANLVSIAFSQRRKTLGRSLRDLLSKEAIAECGIDPRARPETLTAVEFETLAKARLDEQFFA